MKTIVILAHPNFEKSLANKTIINEIEGRVGKSNIRNLTALYPDFVIDVKKEQEALLEADNVIFQFPCYWYSIPPIMKQWIDQVLEYGFAYGEGGESLKGKNFIVSMTSGTPQEAFQRGGANGYTVAEFLKPVEQTAALIQMNYITPICSHSMVAHTAEHRETVIQTALVHANRLIGVIK